MSSVGAVSRITAPDPGPLARLADVTADPDAMDVIAQRVADGEKLKDIAKSWQVPFGKLMLWITADTKRKELYWDAVAFGTHAEMDRAESIADEAEPADVPKARLRVEIRKWRAERLFKDRYAQRTEQTGSQGEPLVPTDPLEIARRMLFVMRMADQREKQIVAEQTPAIEAPKVDDAKPTDDELI